MAELLGQGAGDGPVHISDPLLMWSGGEASLTPAR